LQYLQAKVYFAIGKYYHGSEAKRKGLRAQGGSEHKEKKGFGRAEPAEKKREKLARRNWMRRSSSTFAGMKGQEHLYYGLGIRLYFL